MIVNEQIIHVIIIRQGAGQMRLFVAIRLSDELKKEITGTMHELKKQGIKGSYVPSDNLHMTLAFIGEMAETEKVKAALAAAVWKPFRLSLSEIGNFDDILWIGAKGNQGLSGAARSVREALDSAGIDYDHQKFVPHITIIRSVSGNWKKVKAPKNEMMVKSISLMKSELKDGRRVYTEILSLPV